MFLVWTLMLQAMQQRMQQQSIRRLLVISGESEWCQQQAQWLAATLPGDWPWIGARPPPSLSALASGAVRQLLWQERRQFWRVSQIAFEVYTP